MKSNNIYNLDQEECIEYIRQELYEQGYEVGEDTVFDVYDIFLGLLYYIGVLQSLNPMDVEEDW